MEFKDVKHLSVRLECEDVWVCRNAVDGVYCIFSGDCDPKKNPFDDEWRCECKEYHLIDHFCSSLFKQYTGLPRHMRKGTRKKVRWIYPLQFMEVK